MYCVGEDHVYNKKVRAAEQQVGFLAQCDCGTLHLTVGVVSLGPDREGTPAHTPPNRRCAQAASRITG